MFWNIVVSIATVAAALATIRYVILTNRLLEETIKTRKQQYRPYVVADLEIRNGYLEIIVKNIGNDTALNVHVEVEPAIDYPFNEIEFLPPYGELSYVVEYISSKTPTNYRFSIMYENTNDNLHPVIEYDIDITRLIEAVNVGDSKYDGIVGKLDEIERGLRTISDKIR